MRKFLRSALSLALAGLLASASVVSAAASVALGEDLTQTATTLHEATELNTNVFWSTAYSDLRTENVVTYRPGGDVTPIVTYGDTITARTTVTAAARELESQGYRVVAGINGDFYNTGNGVPIGLVITEGQIRTGASAYYAIGFRADGTAVLGKPGLKYSLNLGANSDGQTVIRSVTDVNKARVSEGGIYLYTYKFNAKHTNGTTEAGVDVVCSIVEGQLSIGTTMTLQVDEVRTGASATPIGENQVVLSANNKAGSYFTDALANLTPGQTVTFSITADETWSDVEYAVGALYSLVSGGAVTSGLPAGQNPRTAIGQKADGTLVFYTIDGRKSGHSIGATLSQIAERMAELGCTEALCLDGGGSTTLSVTAPDATSAGTVNIPSDGGERAVTNQVFLVASNRASGVLSHFYVKPQSTYALAGSTVAVTASGVDTNYIPLNADYTLRVSEGQLTEEGVVLPRKNTEVTVTASGRGRSGSAVIQCVNTVDSLTVSGPAGALSTLTIEPGQSLQLTAKAVYNHLTLFATADAFTWSVSGGVGTVDETGKFTAALQPGSGTLTVTAGGKSVSIPVRISSLPLRTLADFESGLPSWSGSSPGTELERNGNMETVRMGRASAAMSYTLDETTASASLFLSGLSFPVNYNRLNLWVWGDGSGNTLSATTFDGTNYGSVTLTTLDFTGWRQVSARLPEGATSVTDLTVSGSVASGTIYLDQLVCAYNDIVDNTAPAVTARVEGNTLAASVSDNADGIPEKSAVSVSYDGKAISFTYNDSTGVLTAALPERDGRAHRVTVAAVDASGNRGRISVDIAADEGYESAFADTKDYWAATHVDYLYHAGITTGYADGTFRPGRNISRQEFAVMLFRYLGLDGSRYESVTLPFADEAKIGDFARTAVKALYTEGIINGSTGADGRLYFQPAASITRAQAAAMMGRTQPKGYAEAELNFSDAASIPAYARGYIATMVTQGVVGGYADGSFRPGDPISRGQMAKILYNLL